jgi:COP9 signalosome complex subunit 1
MGNEDLGKHYQAIGDLSRAFEAFSRMRQDASIPKHIVDISRHLIEISIEQKNWIAVTSNVQKIKGVMSPADEDKSLQPYLCAAEGLANIDAGDYYNAALQFLQTDAGMGSSCNTIISPNDVAVYGGLCALATMERNELHSKVLDNSNFRTYLELEPHIRRAITFFVNSRYSSCLAILEAYRPDYYLDIHLQKHIDDIYYLVRSKSIVQYFIPFSCVTLDSLNAAFAAPGKTIDKELAMMIQRKDLDARIDTQNRVSIYICVHGI